MRAVLNSLMCILSTGCQWRAPRCGRVLDRIHHAFYVECRERAEREASPAAAIIDSQSVKSASIRLMLRKLCNP
jgi:putative transposase